MDTLLYKGRYITSNTSILEALKKMDDLNCKLLIVLSQAEFIGLISVGDIQRAIIKDLPLTTPINQILRENIKLGSPNQSAGEIKAMMLEYRMELCPVVNSKKQIEKVYFWEDLYGPASIGPKNQFTLPVVIMAGGQGVRLKPLTNVLPKPLIPIGEKTIIEHIFDRFHKHGCQQYFISINYKADLIKYYLKSKNLKLSINYIEENKPSGTAGSLALLKNNIDSTFFVTNCDILIDQDYSEILSYHRANKNEITIIAALKHYPIPYGTIKTSNNGQLVKLTEKPEMTFKINSGMYILEPNLISEIPNDTFFHITQLIDQVKNRGGRIGVFPVSEKSWKDIGEWAEYLKTNASFNIG